MFNTSLLKKSMRVFGDTLLITPHTFFKTGMKYLNDPFLPEYDLIYRSFQKK